MALVLRRADSENGWRRRGASFPKRRWPARLFLGQRLFVLRIDQGDAGGKWQLLVSGCAEGFLALRKDERRTKYVRRGGLGMTPFSWGARCGVVTERTEPTELTEPTEPTEPTLRNQGWGTRKTVSVERAEGRMEALRGSLRQAQGRQDRAALGEKQNTRPDHDTGALVPR